MATLGLPSEVSCALGVVCAIASAAATVVGMLLQKIGFDRENKTIFRLGVLVFTVVKPGGQVVALYFAPVSLIAPLASVTIFLNAVMVPCVQGEQLRPRSIWTSILLVIGCAGTIVTGAHDTHIWSYPELLAMASLKLCPTLVLCALALSSVLGLISFKVRPELVNSMPKVSIALAAAAPAAASAMANVLLKILLTGLSLGPALWLLPVVAGIACCAATQIWSTAVGVELFDMMHYVPMQMAQQILLTIVYSMYIFRETPSNVILFLAFSTATVTGVFMSPSTIQASDAATHGNYRTLDDDVCKQSKCWIQVEDEAGAGTWVGL